MYQRQVSSSPRSVAAIIFVHRPAAAGPSRMRLSISGVTAPPLRAPGRVVGSAVSTPSRIQSVGPVGCPLSNAENRLLDPPATTNGVVARPAAPGSLRSVTGRLASRSPIRLPPPGLE